MAILGGDEHGERGVLVSIELAVREKREVESTSFLVGVSGNALYLRTKRGDRRFVGEFSQELLLPS